jgi:sulfur-carrier protein adenylyltransferase/sulfurtransferase
MTASVVPSLSVQELQARLLSGEAPLLLDVREDQEFAMGHLPNAIHIPLGQLTLRYQELPANKPLVVYCHHGGRSARAVAFLQDSGYDRAMNLTGGIDAWSLNIDPSLPRY